MNILHIAKYDKRCATFALHIMLGPSLKIRKTLFFFNAHLKLKTY